MNKLPSDQKQSKNRIYLERFTTKLGAMFAGATENGICLLEFADRRSLESELKELQRYFGNQKNGKERRDAVIFPKVNRHIRTLKKEVRDYLNGRLQKFSVALDAPGTEFQKKVWKELQKIPYAKTRSYVQQATALKYPKAVRAVANANGRNRIALVIPCHRVIGDDGSLTGYGGGLPRKRWLLEMEEKTICSN